VYSECGQAQAIFLAFVSTTLEDICLIPSFIEPESIQQGADRVTTFRVLPLKQNWMLRMV
jgi:hypothetical protein